MDKKLRNILIIAAACGCCVLGIATIYGYHRGGSFFGGLVTGAVASRVFDPYHYDRTVYVESTPPNTVYIQAPPADNSAVIAQQQQQLNELNRKMEKVKKELEDAQKNKEEIEAKISNLTPPKR